MNQFISRVDKMIESVSSSFSGFPFFGLVHVFVIFIVVIYFRKRVGSSFSVIGRVYALLIGKSEFHNIELQDFWRERQDVERFNAFFNVGVKSLNEAKEFEAWVRDDQLDINIIKDTKGYIDIKGKSVKKVKMLDYGIWIFGCIAFYLMTIVSFNVGVSNYAIMRFTESDKLLGDWFRVDSNLASEIIYYPWSGNGWVIEKEKCAKGNYNGEVIDSLGSNKADVICQSFFYNEEPGINNIIEKQGVFTLLAFVFLATFFATLFIIRKYLRISKARDYLAKRINLD